MTRRHQSHTAEDAPDESLVSWRAGQPHMRLAFKRTVGNCLSGMHLLVGSAIAALCVVTVGLAAQTTRSTEEVSGVVTDPSGALITNATAVLHPAHAPDTNSDSINKTNGVGKFIFRNVTPGSYTVTVSATGFASFQTGILHVDDKHPRTTLTVRLKIEVEDVNVTVSGDSYGLNASPAENGNATVLTGSDIDALPMDSSLLLLQLQSFAGSSNANIYVDGFSGQTLPPKDSIREIRINQNPYSAQNDTAPINGTIEVLTKPGTEKFHGGFSMIGNDSPFNAQNPFVQEQAPYYAYEWQGDVNGPVNHKTAYTFNAERSSFQTNSIINAFVLDPALNQASFSEAVPSPSTNENLSPRLDFQITKNATLMVRYSYTQSQQTNAGVGQLALASQGFNSSSTTQFLQALFTQVIGARTIDETRFQYTRARIYQVPQDYDPTIIVQGAFTGGGNNLGTLRDNQDRFELQNYVSIAAGKHYLNIGGRLRLLRDSNSSETNFNGEFIFPSLAAYQITQRGLAAGETPAQIAASGGGASQFNLNAGDANAVVFVSDEAAFVQDDWRMHPNLTLSAGLRFESQNHISNHADWAPRLGISWGFDNDKSHHPSYVLRGGTGIFYGRLAAVPILQAVRQNGVSQQEYLVTSPTFYPVVPPLASIGSQAQPTIYRIAGNFHAPYFFSSTIGLDRQLGRNVTLSATYLNERGARQLVDLNVNAPLPGTYDPLVPSSGVRPYGTAQNIYQISSEGVYRSNRITTTANVRLGRRLSIHGNYVLRWDRSDVNNGGFPSNQYDIGADYGRSASDNRHQVSVFANWSIPGGVQLGSFLQASSGAPFDITVGQDLNGDGQFNDRPAFATDLNRSSVVTTRWGVFDTNPIPGQTIIPNEYGRGPATYAVYLNIGKTFHFGPADRSGRTLQKVGQPMPKAPGKYSLSFSVNAQNVFNHVNLTPPVGVLNTPLFGTSTALSSSLTAIPSANRVVFFQSSFRF